MDSTCCTAEQLELIGVNAQSIAYAFGWGFGAVALCWSFGFVIGVALAVIRKV